MRTRLMQNTAQNTYFKLDPRTKLLLMLLINIVLIGASIGGIMTGIRLVFAVMPFFPL